MNLRTVQVSLYRQTPIQTTGHCFLARCAKCMTAPHPPHHIHSICARSARECDALRLRCFRAYSICMRARCVLQPPNTYTIQFECASALCAHLSSVPHSMDIDLCSYIHMRVHIKRTTSVCLLRVLCLFIGLPVSVHRCLDFGNVNGICAAVSVHHNHSISLNR